MQLMQLMQLMHLDYLRSEVLIVNPMELGYFLHLLEKLYLTFFQTFLIKMSVCLDHRGWKTFS